MPEEARTRLKRWLLLFAFWTGIGLFFSVQAVLTYLSRGDAARWTPVLVFQMSNWYAWGLLTPPVLWLARRYPLDRDRWRRSLRVHLPASVLIAPLQVVLALLLRTAGLILFDVMEPAQALERLGQSMPRVPIDSFDSLATYWIILGIYYTFDYYRKYREHELQASQLEGQLAQAQLTALKMQLHPHFLFNTLHGISALITEDPEAAERMIARLSDLLRLTLDNAGTQEVPLREELAFLEKYLEIERTRFADRLSVEIDVEPDVLDAQVPNLILQPLVENAIRHGIAPRPEAGFLQIGARQVNGTLRLHVRDDGPGLAAHPEHLREGVGLTNTRARLQQLYGDQATLALDSAEDGGLDVMLTLPLHTTPTAENGQPA